MIIFGRLDTMLEIIWLIRFSIYAFKRSRMVNRDCDQKQSKDE